MIYNRGMTLALKNKKVLLLGLGSLGGGVATVRWLLDLGCHVTVTDLKDDKALAHSVRAVEEHLKRRARDGKHFAKLKSMLAWRLGGHSNDMIDEADLVVANPDVSLKNPYIQYALKKGIPVHNEGTLFYELWPKKLVGITGTRGKTTTATWTGHFIADSLVTGNSVTKPFLSVLEQKAPVAVTELSSFVLEYFEHIKRAPKVAVITNLYQDHLNRHGTMESYARAKANIFAHQQSADTLILNANDQWSQYFVDQKPQARLLWFDIEPLAPERDGLYWHAGALWWQENGERAQVVRVPGFVEAWGEHNVFNLLASALAARAAGVSGGVIQSRIATLPTVAYRQEIVLQSSKLTIINDTTATSPEGGMAAIRRFHAPNMVLICGGTDRQLDYRAWARLVRTHVNCNNLIFLAGSATQKMCTALGTWRRGIRVYSTLEESFDAGVRRAREYGHGLVVFSPAAKSFELFANEFDRGQQFNALVKGLEPKKKKR